ncbi:MAG: DUF433 domain-containing protein [Thermosynechococcaceae cyanobacterium]
MRDWNTDIYNVPTYSVSDAARYLRVPLVTLRTWIQGRTYTTKQGKQHFDPLIQRPNPELSQLSFANLIEAHVLRVIREVHGVRLDKVRTALDYLGNNLQQEHPFIQKTFKTDGISLFIDSMDKLVDVGRSGQLAMRETIVHLLDRVEWDENGIASRLFPFIQPEGDASKLLYLDPRVSFGRPVIAGKGVPTIAIANLYEAGESITDIADEYDCTPKQVKAAIRFETLSRAA